MSDDEELIARLRENQAYEWQDAIWETRIVAADRMEALAAKLAKAVEVIEWALISWDDHNKHGYNMQGDWVFDARATLAAVSETHKIKGESHD